MDNNKNMQLLEAAGILYLTPECAKFEKKGDFVGVTVKANGEEKSYTRVNLHRNFPYDMPWGFISVLDSDSAEIGIIEDVSVFGEAEAELLKNELLSKYYVCRLSSIISVKDRFGSSYWKCLGEDGEVSFSTRTSGTNVIENSFGEIMITDIDGNRYRLPPMSELDPKSRRTVELYL